MTMNANPETVVPAETTPAATPDPAAPEKTEPAAPLSPGEAAKAARVRAEERARLERVKKKSDALHAERQAFEAEKRQAAEMTAKERKEAAERIQSLEKQLAELNSGNPLLRPGVPPERVQEHLRELVAQGTPEAEVIALRKQREADRAEFEAYKKSQEDATKARADEEARRLAEIQKTQEENTVRNFTLWVTSKEVAGNFKFLNAEFSQAEIFSHAARINAWAKENDKVYTGAQVAAYLEKQAEKVHNDRAERRAGLLGATPPATTPAVTESKVAPPVSGKKPPVQVRHKTKEEEIEADLAVLRKATEADRLARAKSK